MRPRIKKREVEKPGSAAFLMSGQVLLVLPIMLCLFFSVVVVGAGLTADTAVVCIYLPCSILSFLFVLMSCTLEVAFLRI